jgi:hypothetical protein
MRLEGVRLAGMGLLLLLGACASTTAPARRPTPEPRADWSLALQRLLPAIRTCLAGTEDAVGVTKAWPIGHHHLAGVRVLRPDGTRLDCIAADDGRKIILTERVRPTSSLPGERDPLFTPQGREPPRSPCLKTATAPDGTGRAAGWVSYDICRSPRPVARSGEAAPSAAPAARLEGCGGRSAKKRPAAEATGRRGEGK